MSRMPLKAWIEKNLLFFGVTFYYLGGYFAINWLTSRRSDLHQLALPFEENLPFVPSMIFAYLLIFAFVSAPYLVVDDPPFFRKVAKSFFVCVTIHFIIFLIFPVEYRLRPHVNYEAGWLNRVVVFYYWLDLPYNSFPSMHISNAFMVSFFLDRYRPGWGKILVPISVLISLSVVLVKQHYLVDVVAGFVVGWLVFRWVFGSKTP